jgi:hypothetical protein
MCIRIQNCHIFSAVLVFLLSGDWFSFLVGCLIKKIEIFRTAVTISDGFVFAKSAFFYPKCI